MRRVHADRPVADTVVDALTRGVTTSWQWSDRRRIGWAAPRAGEDTVPVMLLRLPGTYRAQGDTRLLAGVVEASGLARGARVLDVGTGSGALAVTAARAGAATVTAIDLSRRSVITARLNSALHGARLRVHRGDLVAPVHGRRFDLVLSNPPYVPAATSVLPRHRPGRSWDAGTDGRAVLDRICEQVPALLADGGVLLLTQSVVADAARTVALLRAAGLDVAVVARAQEPYGPVMRGRADLLAERGLVAVGQRSEELVVIAASDGPLAWPITVQDPLTGPAPRPGEEVRRAA